MKNLIDSIVEKKYDLANEELDSIMPSILDKKLFEMKKMVAAKMGIDEMHMVDFNTDGAEDDQKQMPTKSKLTKADQIKEQFRKAFDGGSGARQEKLKRDIVEDDMNLFDDDDEKDKKEKARTYRHETSGKEVKLVGKPPKGFKLVKEEDEQLDEARVKIVKARVRGGKIQRRKKVSNVSGMTLRGGQLKRMSAVERRNRKMGARRGKIKRRSKMARAMIKRAKSMRKRASIGL